MKRHISVLIMVAIVSTAAGCGTSTIGSSANLPLATASASPSPGFLTVVLPTDLLTTGSNLASTVTIPGHKIEVRPATNAKAATSPAQALQSVRGTGLYPQATSGTAPPTKLGLLFNYETKTMQPDGSLSYDYSNRLVWILSYPNIPDEIGPLGGSIGESPATNVATRDHVNLVFLVDANTGKYLEAIDDTVHQPPLPTSSVGVGKDGKPLPSDAISSSP